MAGLSDAIFNSPTNAVVSPLLKNLYSAPVDPTAAQNAVAQTGDLGRGMASAALGLKAGTQRYFGADEAARQTAQEAAQWAPEIEDTNQVHGLGDAARYAAGQIGAGLVSVPVAAAGALAGRFVAPLAGIAPEVGSLVGGALSQHTGTTGNELLRMDNDPAAQRLSGAERRARAELAGGASDLLQAVPEAHLVGRALERQVVGPLSSIPGSVLKHTAKSALEEAGTSAAGDAVMQANQMNYDPTHQYDLHQTEQQAIGGAIGIAPIAGATHAVSSGLDYAAAGGNAAVDGINGLSGVTPSMPSMTRDGVTTAAGKALSAVNGLVRGGTISDYFQHPELSTLMNPQVLPEGHPTDNAAVSSWLAQDDAKRNAAAAAIAQRTLADNNAPDDAKAAAQDFLSNPVTPNSWKTFSSNIKTSSLAARTADNIGRFGSWASGKLDEVKKRGGEAADAAKGFANEVSGKAKNNSEHTETDKTYLNEVSAPIRRAAGISNVSPVDGIATALRQYITSGFAADKHGNPVVPPELVNIFGKKTGDVVAHAYHTLRRLGVVRDTPEMLAKLDQIAPLSDEHIKSRDKAEQIVKYHLTPTMLRQSTHDLPELAEGIRHYLRRGGAENTPREVAEKRAAMDAEEGGDTRKAGRATQDAAIEAQLDQLFGPNKDDALAQLSALDDVKYGSQADELTATNKPKTTDGEDSGSDVAHEDFENGMTEYDAPGEEYHFNQTKDDPKRAFDSEDPFFETNVARAMKRIGTAGKNVRLNKDTLEYEASTNGINPTDYAERTGDYSVLDKLREDHPRLSDDEINSRFFVMTSQAREDMGMDPVDIPLSEISEPAQRDGKDNPRSWKAIARLDSKHGNVDLDNVAHGRVSLVPVSGKLTGGGTETFLTSAQKIITRMWAKKGRGAFQGETAEAVGPADMLNMFSAGITSLLEVGATPEHDGIGEVPAKDHYFYGDMYVKDAHGKRITISDMRGFPDDFVLYEGKGYKVTMGDARADIAKDSVRDTRGDKPLKNARSPENPEGETRKPPKRATDKLEADDYATATRTELQAEYAKTRNSLMQDEYAQLHASLESSTPAKRIERAKRMAAIRKHFGEDAWKLDNAKTVSEEIRSGLQSKLERLAEEGSKRTDDKAPTVAKETAGIVGEDTLMRSSRSDKAQAADIANDAAGRSSEAPEVPTAASGIVNFTTIDRSPDGKIFRSKQDAEKHAIKGDKLVPKAFGQYGRWYIQRPIHVAESGERHFIGESEEMAASAAEEHDNKERTFDEETGLDLHAKTAQGADERVRTLDSRLDTLRRKYAAVQADINRYKDVTSKNAVRDANIAKWKRELNDLKEKGIALAEQRKQLLEKIGPLSDSKKTRGPRAVGGVDRLIAPKETRAEKIAREAQRNKSKADLEALAERRKELIAMAEEAAAKEHANKPKLPTKTLYAKKDQAKSDKANKFIGRGSEGSSTAAYAQAWGDRANTGEYNPTDHVFVSVEGSRAGRKPFDRIELQKALDAKATIITDDAANRERAYNLGEREVAGYLVSKGYKEVEPGTWKHSTVTYLSDARWGVDREKIESIVADMSDDDFNTLQNDTLARDPLRKQLPSIFKDYFNEWLDEYGAEREDMMSPEEQPNTERRFLQEVVDAGPDDYGAVMYNLAKAILSGSDIAVAKSREGSNEADREFAKAMGEQVIKRTVDISKAADSDVVWGVHEADGNDGAGKLLRAFKDHDTADYYAEKVGGTLVQETVRSLRKEDPKFRTGENTARVETTRAHDAAAAKDMKLLSESIGRYLKEPVPDGTYQAATLFNHAALSQVAAAFGAKVRGFSVHGEDKHDFFNGVHIKTNKDTVYLNNKSKRPHMALMGHELVHRMQQTNPALYNKFLKAVTEHIKPEAYRAWAKVFTGKTSAELNDAGLKEEFLAEVMSDGMMNRDFWESLATHNMNLAKQVYAAAMRMFSQIMRTVGYTPKTKSVLDDYTAVMKIAGKVMAEHGEARLVKMNEATVKGVDGAKFNSMSTDIHNDLGKEGFAATHDSPIRHEGKFDWRKNSGKSGPASFGAGTYLSTADKEHGRYKAQYSQQIGEASPTYHVTVNAKPGEMMKWREAFSKQSALVQGALQTAAKEFNIALHAPDEYNPSEQRQRTGEDIYGALAAKLGSQAKTSDYLQSLGIIGHSLNVDEGKPGKFPNYVIYDDSRIENNAVSFNKETTNGEANNAAEQEMEAINTIYKLIGKDVDAAFAAPGVLKGSATWTRDPVTHKAIIRIAADALDPKSKAYHEAMHEFFQRLLDDNRGHAADVLQKAADSALVQRQMERTFANEPEVLKQIATDPSERVAYMFQLWAAGKLNIGDQTETVFRKALNMVRKVFGMMTNDKKALEILQNFAGGNMSDRGAMARVLDTQEARGAYVRKVATILKPVMGRANEWAGFAENALTDSGNPALDWVGRAFHNKTGTTGDKQGFLSAKNQANSQWMNKFATALRGVDVTGADKRVAERADVDAALEGLQKKEWSNDPVVRRIQEGVAATFKEMYGYMEEAGVKRFDAEKNEWVPVRKVDDYRIPTAWDPARIIANSAKFKALLHEHHGDILQKLADKANKEIADGKNAGKYTASWEKMTNNDKTEVTAENVADALMQRLINSDGQVEFKENENALGFSPFMKSVNERTLGWIDHKVFSDFQQKDMVNILSSYVGQATKRAEYSRRFGPDGGILQDKMEAAWYHEVNNIMKSKHNIDSNIGVEWGAANDDKGSLGKYLSSLGKDVDGDAVALEALKKLEPARRAVMAMEGTLGHDISPLARKASSYMMVYQNVRLLGYSMFSNVIDPLGIMVNGGEMKDAFAAFKRGMRDVVREWGDLTGLRAAKDTDHDEATKIAEMIGTVDSAGFMSSMGSMFGSQYLSPGVKKINDDFFRWNGTEALNRAMRVQATQAAISFIKRNYEAPNEHTERRFKELGLDKKDISVGEDGRLNVDNRNVQQAIMRWVDGAVLRPNAAMRPTMASDPHYATFYHLKQFMYAMHSVILKRAQIEIKNGNSDPLLLLVAGYIPTMIAADAAKGLLQTAMGGGAPVWEHDGVAGIISHGVQRAGLLGIAQMPVDAMTYGPLELGGPAVEQVASAFSDPLAQTLTSALAVGPANMLLKGANWDQ